MAAGTLDDDAARREAVDPSKSIIVQAPAGSGKTSLLVQRYLNLLALVDAPEEILAITFTRKAANEMRHRVVHELEEDSQLAQRIRQRSDDVGWDLAQNPDRLKIQTIDSFSFALVQRLPFSSRFGLDFQFIEDARWLYQEAAARLLERCATDDPLADDIAGFMARLDNDYTTSSGLLAEMLARRDQWIDPISDIAAVHARAEPERFVAVIEASIASLHRRVVEPMEQRLGAAVMEEARELCAFAASNLGRPFRGFEDLADWQLLGETLTTTEAKPRKQINVKLGFPPQAKLEKSRCAQLIDTCAQIGAIETLASLRFIPDISISPHERDTLASFAVTLSLAALELSEVFKDERVIDFTELTLSAQRALAHDDMPTELALALDYRISHILVDEFQDTSLAQYRLLTRLMDGWTGTDGNTFFAVGDPMQSIYRFRDADLSLYQNTFVNGMPQQPLQPVHLTSNFRSSANLVDWCNRIFAELFAGPEDPVLGAVRFAPATAVQEMPGAVNLTLCRDDDDTTLQADLIAARVAALRSDHPDESIALLVRSRNVLPPIFDAMRRAEIRWHGLDIEPLVDVPVVRDLYALTRALNDYGDRLAWLAVFRSPLIGVELADLEKLAPYEDANRMMAAPDLSRAASYRLARLTETLDRVPSDRSLRARVEQLWLMLGGADAYRDHDALTNADRYLDLLEQQTAAGTDLQLFFAQLSGLYASELGGVPDVEIMTIHRAKGLEFDHVILAGLERGGQSNPRPLLLWRPEADGLLMATRDTARGPTLYNWLRHEEVQRDANELVRLLYVAVTRAISTLWCYASSDDFDSQRGSFLELISPFFLTPTVETRQTPSSQGALFTSQMWSRLKHDYVWQPPVTLPSVSLATTEAIDVVQPNERDSADPIHSRREVALGLLLHDELRRIARTPAMNVAYDVAHWRDRLSDDGFDSDAIDWVVDHAETQIANVRADAQGQWLLDSRREEGATEASFTGLLDGRFVNVVIDRTFVDDDGSRWIVDYKSTTDMSGTDFVERQVKRHRAQLIRYSQIISAIDPRPIRIALYLTAVPTLVEIRP